MDLTYDYLGQDTVVQEREGEKISAEHAAQQPSLNDDIQDAYKAISSSAWGMKIGGFLRSVVKQGESVYTQAQKELSEVGEDATKGLTDLRETIMSRTRSLTLSNNAAPDQKDGDDTQSTPTESAAPTADDAEQHSESVLSRLRLEAAKRLKDLQRAEDAADEALLRFGSNVRDLLRDAISIAPPEKSDEGSNTVLFESKDARGRRAIHTSRFDAQLHVIHSSIDRFTQDPTGDEYDAWSKDFDVESKTEDISSELAKYPELRGTMEQLVPNQVPYADFWKRYYFFRNGIETAESRRRDLLQAASAEDDIGWGDDSDDEEAPMEAHAEKAASAASSTTLQPQSKHQPQTQPESEPQPKAQQPQPRISSQSKPQPGAQASSKTSEARKSNDEKSVADSEGSYDIVSGAASGKTSQAPSSPTEGNKADDSDDDWE